MGILIERPQFDLDLLTEGKAYIVSHKVYDYLYNQHCILKYRDNFRLVFTYAKFNSRNCLNLEDVSVSIDDVVRGDFKIAELVEE